MAHGQFNRSNKSYEKYKANLNALFDGKKKLSGLNIPVLDSEHPIQPIETKPSRRRSATPVFGYDIFLEAIKRSTTPDEVTRTVNAFLNAGHQIPLDEDILSKGLIHRDESIVVLLLHKLKELLDKQSPKSPRLLKTRLENLLLLCPSLEIKELTTSLLSSYTT